MLATGLGPSRDAHRKRTVGGSQPLARHLWHQNIRHDVPHQSHWTGYNLNINNVPVNRYLAYDAPSPPRATLRLLPIQA